MGRQASYFLGGSSVDAKPLWVARDEVWSVKITPCIDGENHKKHHVKYLDLRKHYGFLWRWCQYASTVLLCDSLITTWWCWGTSVFSPSWTGSRTEGQNYRIAVCKMQKENTICNLKGEPRRLEEAFSEQSMWQSYIVFSKHVFFLQNVTCSEA